MSVAIDEVPVDPARTQFRAGIVNIQASVGIRVTPQGSDPVVELVRGSGGLIRFAASRQLSSKGQEPITLEVVRIAVNSQICPQLPDSVEKFYGRLVRTSIDALIGIGIGPYPPVAHAER